VTINGKKKENGYRIISKNRKERKKKRKKKVR
jgi:hypothetical protein